mgnify:CR=1 FL=1
MNLRDKFLWNGVVLISLAAIAWSSWQLYSTNIISNNLLINYNKEQVGTDEELEKKVLKLELYDQKIDKSLERVICSHGD